MSLLLLLGASSGTAEIAITSPVAAARVLVGESVTVDATETATSGNVDILLSIDNGVSFTTIAAGVVLPYTWVPTASQIAAQAVLRVRDSADALTVDDQSIVVASTSALATLADVRRETARVNGEVAYPIYGDGPLFALDAGDGATAASFPCIMHDGTNWRLTYSNGDTIRYRTSANGKTGWSASATLLTKQLGGDEHNGIYNPRMWKEGAAWHLIYGGYDGTFVSRILYATSSDGTTWTRQGRILVADQTWEHGSIIPDSVRKIGSTYYLWYSSTGVITGYDKNDRRINYATSTNLTTWTKHVGPVFGEKTDIACRGPFTGYANAFVFADTSAASQIWYMLNTFQQSGTDYQELQLWTCQDHTFPADKRRFVATILAPRSGVFPDSETSCLCVAVDNINGNSYTLAGGEIRVYVAVKHAGVWYTALLVQPNQLEAFRSSMGLMTLWHNTISPRDTKTIEDRAAASASPIVAYTTIASLTSQTVFRLAAGPSNDDATDGCVAVLTSNDGTKASRVPVADYDGGNLEVTLSSAPKFTIAVGDFVAILASGSTASGGSGSGSGPRTVTITVTDGTDPLQNAAISLREGATLYSTTTNASGIAVFNVDDATYTVAITKSGYSFAGASLVVDGTESVTYAMTQITITPGAGDLTTGVLTVLDTAGQPVGSVVISIEQRSAPDASYGFAFDGTKRTVTSAVNGVAQIPGLVKGATYKVYRGDRQGYDCKIPIDAGSTYELPSIVGVSA